MPVYVVVCFSGVSKVGMLEKMSTALSKSIAHVRPFSMFISARAVSRSCVIVVQRSVQSWCNDDNDLTAAMLAKGRVSASYTNIAAHHDFARKAMLQTLASSDSSFRKLLLAGWQATIAAIRDECWTSGIAVSFSQACDRWLDNWACCRKLWLHILV